MWPRQTAETRSQRLRSRLSQRKRLLPAVLSARILDDGETLEFDLTSTWVDALELLRLAKAFEADRELRSNDLKHSVGALLAQAPGTFMEFWEELEKRAVEGDPETSTRALVSEIRGRLERCRADPLLALGRNALWAQ